MNTTPAPQKPSAPVELLDVSPPVMRRPLALIERRTYAAVWHYVRVINPDPHNTGNETTPPLEQTRLQCFIIRDDGVLFGEGGDYPCKT